jgi:hypothetical protein
MVGRMRTRQGAPKSSAIRSQNFYASRRVTVCLLRLALQLLHALNLRTTRSLVSGTNLRSRRSNRGSFPHAYYSQETFPLVWIVQFPLFASPIAFPKFTLSCTTSNTNLRFCKIMVQEFSLFHCAFTTLRKLQRNLSPTDGTFPRQNTLSL